MDVGGLFVQRETFLFFSPRKGHVIGKNIARTYAQTRAVFIKSDLNVNLGIKP